VSSIPGLTAQANSIAGCNDSNCCEQIAALRADVNNLRGQMADVYRSLGRIEYFMYGLEGEIARVRQELIALAFGLGALIAVIAAPLIAAAIAGVVASVTALTASVAGAIASIGVIQGEIVIVETQVAGAIVLAGSAQSTAIVASGAAGSALVLAGTAEASALAAGSLALAATGTAGAAIVAAAAAAATANSLGVRLPPLEAKADTALGQSGTALSEVRGVQGQLERVQGQVEQVYAEVGAVRQQLDVKINEVRTELDVKIAQTTGEIVQVRNTVNGQGQRVNQLGGQVNTLSGEVADLQRRPSGQTGPQGSPGTNGRNGTNGANGRDGQNGRNGTDGANGQPGSNGRNGTNGANGQPGTSGRNGANGANGQPGRNGTNAAPGANGLIGRNGTNGANGVNGRDGVNGQNGAPGTNGAPGQNGKDGKDGITTIVQGANVNPGKENQIIDLIRLLPATFIASQAYRDAAVADAAKGACQSSKPGGCEGGSADQISKLGGLLNGISAGVGVLNNAVLGTVTSTLNVINTKLGGQIVGGLSAWSKGIAEVVNKSQILNVLTYISTLHNAYMLSNALSQTLFSAVGNSLAAIGLKDTSTDPNGTPFNVAKIVNDWTETFFKTVFGVTTVDGIKADWKKYSRIYQAAAQLLSSLQSIGHSILGALEVVGSHVAKIGNALQKFRVVSEKAYAWMNPTPSFQNRFLTGLQTAQTVVSQVDQVASETLSIQQQVQEIQKNSTELQKTLKQEPNSAQATPTPEAVKVKEAAAEVKLASKSPPIPETAIPKPD
jgi:peptidoglycan hydrolase CwlO-like protein